MQHGEASQCGGTLGTVRGVRQPTFDMNIFRVALESSRPGHESAVRLLELARDGLLEVGVPPQGVRADLRGDMTTPQAQAVLALLSSPGVVELHQLAYPSNVTYPGFFPEQPTQGFAKAWTAIEESWNGPGRNPRGKDRWYVESHVARRRDILVTDDVGMQTMCRRLREEHAVDITAESLADYAARFSSKG